MVLLSLENVQLHHLQHCLAEIIDDVQVEDNGEITIKKNGKSYPAKSQNFYTQIELEEKRKLFLLWISHHQQLLNFHEEIRKIYYAPLCVIFTNIVLTLCLIAFLNIVVSITIECVIYGYYNSLSFSGCFDNNRNHRFSCFLCCKLLYVLLYLPFWRRYKRNRKSTT